MIPSGLRNGEAARRPATGLRLQSVPHLANSRPALGAHMPRLPRHATETAPNPVPQLADWVAVTQPDQCTTMVQLSSWMNGGGPALSRS
jgi:hypothetical protein